MTFKFKGSAAIVGILAAILSAGAHSADKYPSRPITLVVPFPAGSVTDAQGRSIAKSLGQKLGQPVVVDNRPGVAGAIGANYVATSTKPDGYSLVFVSTAGLATFPHMQATQVDPRRDLDYIIALTGYTLGLTVRSDAKWKTIDDLVQEAKSQPGKVTYATSGVGGGTHLSMEQFATCKGVKLNHIPYKGGADATVAMLAGHVDAQNDGAWGALVDGGKGRLLMVTTPDRTSFAPEVPTLQEQCPGVFVDRAVLGIAAPAGLDPKVKKALHDAIKEASSEPEFLNVLKQSKQQSIYMGSDDFKAYLVKLYDEKGALLRKLGMSTTQ